MRTSILLSATFVAAAFAAPQRRDLLVDRAIVYDIKTVTDTVYVTEGYEPTSILSTSTTVKASPLPPPASTTTHYSQTSVTPEVVAPVEVHVSTPVVTYVPKTTTVQPVSTSAPTKSSPSTTNDGSPLSDGVSVLSTCNKYRSKYNLNSFKWSSLLNSNACATGKMNNGQTENHKLYDGSFAQVITPGLNSDVPGVSLGGFTPFEMGYLSWLCEKSSDSQLSSLCPTMQSAMHMMYSSTGHYDILTSTSYSSIGCCFTADPSASSTSPYQGIWVCDLA